MQYFVSAKESEIQRTEVDGERSWFALDANGKVDETMTLPELRFDDRMSAFYLCEAIHLNTADRTISGRCP